MTQNAIPDFEYLFRTRVKYVFQKNEEEIKYTAYLVHLPS